MNLHIESKRLIIRNFQKDDWEDVASWCTDAKTMHYIPIGVLTPQEVKEIVSESPDEETECYAIYEKNLARVIGEIIYHPWYNPLTWELGWIIHSHFQKQGYASEAAQAVLAYGFQSQKLHRIIATCQPDNRVFLCHPGRVLYFHQRCSIPRGDQSIDFQVVMYS